MDKNVQSVASAQYDLEVLKMAQSNFALKKEVEDVNSKFANYCTRKTFEELQKDCRSFAQSDAVRRLADEVHQLDRG